MVSRDNEIGEIGGLSSLMVNASRRQITKVLEYAQKMPFEQAVMKGMKDGARKRTPRRRSVRRS